MSSRRPLSERDRLYAASFRKVSVSFIEEAVTAASRHKLTMFDTEAATETVAYERTVRPLINELRGTLRALEDGVLSRHQRAAEHALAVYAALKGLVRFDRDTTTQQQLDELYRMVAPRRRPKPKPEEAAAAAKKKNGDSTKAGKNKKPQEGGDNATENTDASGDSQD
jgi:hypothetical protein